MGLRYRKSVNFKNGFRLNFSKSGIGYSWGFPGFRLTKTAKKQNRMTVSIPGSGISWVKEGGCKQKSKKEKPLFPAIFILLSVAMVVITLATSDVGVAILCFGILAVLVIVRYLRR